MDRHDVIVQLKEIVKPYSKNLPALDTIGEDTDFIKDLKINSANLVDVVLDVEEKFDITIDNESMEKMLTVKASIDIIQQKIEQK